MKTIFILLCLILSSCGYSEEIKQKDNSFGIQKELSYEDIKNNNLYLIYYNEDKNEILRETNRFIKENSFKKEEFVKDKIKDYISIYLKNLKIINTSKEKLDLLEKNTSSLNSHYKGYKKDFEINLFFSDNFIFLGLNKKTNKKI